ncbi:MAG: enoyl-CoA hydratase/isomerase family protein [Halodesulfurarchaeum sp.]
MTDDAVTLDVEDEVATLTLSRPESRNALTHEVAAGISDAIEAVPDTDARIVVIEGEGPAFSAGGDIQSMNERFEGDGEPLHEVTEHIASITGQAIADVAECTLPTVALVDGTAFGAGANLAIAADVVLASDDAEISFGFRQVGLAVDAGTSYLLPRIVGESVALELVYTGELLDAERADDLGIFNHVYEAERFEAEAESMIETIANGPTVALAASKRSIRKGLSSSLREALENEADAQAAVFETHDHEEGVTAFLERREPSFEGR